MDHLVDSNKKHKNRIVTPRRVQIIYNLTFVKRRRLDHGGSRIDVTKVVYNGDTHNWASYIVVNDTSGLVIGLLKYSLAIVASAVDVQTDAKEVTASRAL